jgi:hypothetical protein
LGIDSNFSSVQRHAVFVEERRSNVMELDRFVFPAERLTCPASTKTPCDAGRSPIGTLTYVCSIQEAKQFRSEERLQELEQRIRSLQDELNEAHTTKRRRLMSDDNTGPEHVQLSDESDSEVPSPKDDTISVPFEAEADRGDGDGGSYTLKTPKGAMRFFGQYWLTDNGFTVDLADSTNFQVHPPNFQLSPLRVWVGLKVKRGIIRGAMSPRETAADGG